MKKILYSFIVLSMLLVSCKKETKEETISEEIAADSTPTDTTAAVVPTQPNTNGTNPNTIMNQPNASGMQATPAQSQPVAVGKGMNPAHGQPGHKCEIPVGAPLNSTPTKTNAPQTVVQKQVVTPQQLQNGSANIGPVNQSPASTASPVATAPGMNPPHGQEGHVCAVPVGSPLPKS